MDRHIMLESPPDNQLCIGKHILKVNNKHVSLRQSISLDQQYSLSLCWRLCLSVSLTDSSNEICALSWD